MRIGALESRRRRYICRRISGGRRKSGGSTVALSSLFSIVDYAVLILFESCRLQSTNGNEFREVEGRGGEWV